MIGHLQQVYDKHKDRGFVLLGLNCSDSRPVADQLLRANKVTFPNILDTSDAARQVVGEEYQTVGMSAVPLEYIIDRDGKIVLGWYGANFPLVEKELKKLGIE